MPIKLFQIGGVGSVERFQSQLRINTDTVDFIKDKEGMKNYGYGENGFDFYKYTEPYEIITNVKEMATQQLGENHKS